MNDQTKLVFDADPRDPKSGCVRVHNLQPDLVSFLRERVHSRFRLQSILRVRVVEPETPQGLELPDVFGRYQVVQNGLQFTPYFPFERDVKYRAIFDPRPLGPPLTAEPSDLEFLIPSEEKSCALTEVTHIFPSGDLLPENLLRFYVFFSTSMQRGRALEEIALFDSDGQRVADALYRAPVELWDRGMERLTVLLDPGRLKRWVGPNVQLGPPLKVGQTYTLEIGSGMMDLHGRPLRARFRKHFLAGDPVREPISVENWKVHPPATCSRQALVLTFPSPLDRLLLIQTLTVESGNRLAISGQVEVDRGETRWSFTPTLPWIEESYRIRVATGLEDVCGNTIAGAFDKPLRKDPNPAAGINGSSLAFQLI